MFIILIVLGILIVVGISAKYYLLGTLGRLNIQLTDENKNAYTLTSKEWWAKKRAKYNWRLLIAGFTAFVAYAILGELLIAPYDNAFEVTLFTIFFQGIGYLFMMLIANLFYNLGHFVDIKYNKDNSEVFRQQLFNLGFWFSVGLPFLIPILIVVEYFIRFA